MGTSGEQSLRRLIAADLAATTHDNYRVHGSAARFRARALAKLAVSPNVRAVVWYRIAHALARRRLMPLALMIRGHVLRSSGADIHPLASFGPGLYLVHSSGVVVGPDAVVGARARLHQGATIGGPQYLGDGRWGHQRIGDDVMLGAHAVLLGDITVGDRVRVGANAVVIKDVASDQHVAGVPAVVIPQ